MKFAAQSAIRAGMAVTACVALLPYLRDFFVVACMAGLLAAVWFAVRKRHENLSFKEGADLGFRSGFYGLLLAITIYDVIWRIFHYQLWQIQNIDRMVALFSGMVEDAFRPSVWIMITLQIVTAAICAGAIATPVGMLGVRIFGPRPAS